MPTTFDFTNLFIRPPGDLLYYLAVIALSQASFFMALGTRMRRPHDRPPQIYTLATLGMVAVWLLLLLGAVYALLTDQPADGILPPLERLVQTMTILLIGWAFLTVDAPQNGRMASLVLLALLIVVILGYVITGIAWADLYARSDFNLTAYGVAWTFIAALLALVGAVLTLLYLRVVIDAPLKFVFFVLLLIGFASTLAQISQGNIIGDYAGAARLAFFAAMLIVPSVIYRMVILGYEDEIAMTATDSAPLVPVMAEANRALPPPNGVPGRESAQLMRALGMMLEDATPTTIRRSVVMAAMNVLKSDIGALLTVKTPSYADIAWGQDRVMERSITGMSINLDEQPTLLNAIERQSQRPLYPDRNVDELHDLYARLDIEPIGPTYCQPLVKSGRVLGVLILGMPYSGRELSEPERELLKGIAIISANLLSLTASEQPAIGVALDDENDLDTDQVKTAWQEARAELDAARGQVAELMTQVTALKIELDSERTRVTAALTGDDEVLSVSQRVIAMTEANQLLLDERDRLASRLRDAETALAGVVSGDNEAMLDNLVEVLRRERDELSAQRQRLQAELAEMRAGAPVPQVVREMLERLTAEKATLEIERERLSEQLTDIEAQLSALGIQVGGAGVAPMIAQLYEQRSNLQIRFETVKRERDTLQAERKQIEAEIVHKTERDQQLATLQAQVEHLAADREAITKQRERVRAERDELLARQAALRDQQARSMAELAGLEQELAEAQADQAQLRDQLQEAQTLRSQLATERDRLRAHITAVETERDQLLARTEGDRERLQQLGADGVGSLVGMVETLSAQRAELERELQTAQIALSAADDRFEALQRRAAAAPPPVVYRPDNPELMLGMIQELRTPMTSIVGYVDLMLSESAGILGEMQRKFLQRVSANVTRLAAMLEDLARISFLDAGRFSLAAEPVDVVGLVEDAITAASSQLREKGLTVQLDLDDDAPPVRADKDALTQVIGQLLTNAYLASPPNSEIFVTARRGDQADRVLVSIEDRGGGIAPEDLPRVFARKYKAENPLVQGLGDTGVGLAIAKALIEAHGGAIWVDVRPNVGSAFNFTLPYALNGTSTPEGAR